MHRTGILAYLLLRIFGFGAEEAYSNLDAIREETYMKVGHWRIQYAEQLFETMQAGKGLEFSVL